MKLSDFIKTREVKVPGYDLTIVVKEEFSWFEYVEATKIADDNERGIYTMSKLIVSWNITGDDGAVLPINEETIKSLPSGVARVVIDEFNAIYLERSKKKMT